MATLDQYEPDDGPVDVRDQRHVITDAASNFVVG